MGQIVVTHASGATFNLGTSNPYTVITNCVQKRALMDEDIVEMTVISTSSISFWIKDRITVHGLEYVLNTMPDVVRTGDRQFEYNLVWEGYQYDMQKVIYMNEDASGVAFGADFSLMGNMSRFIDVMVLNMVRVFGSGTWAKGSFPSTDTRNLNFTNETCLGVLNKLCDEFSYEWTITMSGGVKYINVLATAGRTLTDTFSYGKAKGLISLSRKSISDVPLFTRLYAFGSDKNIPANYRNYSPRLMIPSVTKSYVENSAAITTYGLREYTKIYEEIYPRRTGTISSLGANERTFVDSSMDFDLNAVDGIGNTLYLIAGVQAKISIKTGKLAGYEFTIASYAHSTKTFVVNAIKDERGFVLPNPTVTEFKLAAGDTYVLLDINMPATYVTNAENELLAKANADLALGIQPMVQFEADFDEMYWTDHPPARIFDEAFLPGDTLTIYDEKIGVNQTVRVESFERDAFRTWRYSFKLLKSQYRKFRYKMARVYQDNKHLKKILDEDDPGHRRVLAYVNQVATSNTPSAD